MTSRSPRSLFLAAAVPFGIALVAAGCRNAAPDPALLATMTPDGWPIGSGLAVGSNAITVTNDRSFEKTIGNERRGTTEEMVIPFRTGRITLIVGPPERRGNSTRARRFRPTELLAWRDAEERRLEREGGYRKIAYKTTSHEARSYGTHPIEFACRRWDYTLDGRYRIMFVFDQEPYASAAEVQASNRREAELLARRLYPMPSRDDDPWGSASAPPVR